MTSEIDATPTPSAILWDGHMLVAPLFAVNRISLSERYSLPPIGSTSFRALVDTSDDSISLSGLLIGPSRFLYKLLLEQLADVSRRGSFLATASLGHVGGLILLTSMTVRVDMQVTDLSFTASSHRRDTLEVAISLKHVPRPGPVGLLLDVAATAVMSLVEYV